MVIKNLSTRQITLRDEDGNLYVVPSLGELTLDDSLIEDNTFRRWLRWRLRDIYISPFVNIDKNGIAIDSKPTLNFIEGTNTTITTTSHTDSIDIQIDAAADVDYNNLSNVPSVFPVAITKAGAAIGTRTKINFIEGANVTLTVADNPGSARVDVTVAATGTLSIAWADITGKPTSFAPSGHQSSHQAGGSDALTGNLGANARVAVAKNGAAATGTRRKLNFIEGSGILIFTSDDNANEKIDINIQTTGLAPSNASYITLQAESGLSNESPLGTTIVMRGPASSLPAAAWNGKLYCITDVGQRRIVRDNGSGWDDLIVDWDYVGSKPTTFTPSAHATNHQTGGSDPIKLDDLATPDDNTDLNASTAHHGLMPKLSGDSSQVFKGDGTFGASALSSVQRFLTADVTLSSANAFFNLADLSNSCVAGTWLVIVTLCITRASNPGNYTAKLWNGGLITYAGIQTNNGGGSGDAEAFGFSAIITLNATTALQVSVAADQTQNVVRATPTLNGTGLTNKVTSACYIKLG